MSPHFWDESYANDTTYMQGFTKFDPLSQEILVTLNNHPLIWPAVNTHPHTHFKILKINIINHTSIESNLHLL
jgi:hypothetical protein